MRILRTLLRRPASLVGIDIGSSAVKAAELSGLAGGKVLARAGVQPVPAESIVKGTIADEPAVADAVRSLLDSAGIRGRDVALSLPGSAVVAREITMPRMSPRELAGSISWEAEQHIPFDLRDVNLDYQVVEHATGAGRKGTMVVLLVAAKKRTVTEYVAAITRAGCTPAVVDVAAFALQNAHALHGDSNGARFVALLNAGASTINVNIVCDGRSVFTRDIAAGGNAYTDALRSGRAVSFEEAERLKMTGGRGDADIEELEPALREVTDRLLLEVEKTFDFFAAGSASGPIGRIVLSGGVSRGLGFAAAMARRFDAPVERFDPFQDMSVEGMSATGGKLADVAATAGVATGLALRRVGDR